MRYVGFRLGSQGAEDCVFVRCVLAVEVGLSDIGLVLVRKVRAVMDCSGEQGRRVYCLGSWGLLAYEVVYCAKEGSG